MNGSTSLNSVHSFSSETSGPLAVTTENWLELLLGPSEKRTFSEWKEKVKDKSITHRATQGIFDWISTYIPDNIAPNLVTATGFLCLSQAWYMTNLYGEAFPVSCTWFAVANIIVFFITNSVDLKHADRIRQRTALGDLFKYCANCCSTAL